MMQSLTDCYTLENGVKIPCLGFGTWKAPDGDVAKASVLAALECGYRHIDTASAYRNEASVGRGIQESGLKREELFITTKLNNPVCGYRESMEAFEESMEKLQLEYLDLYLIHWPNPKPYRDRWQERNAENWRAMEDLYKAGRIRAIGISNFRPHHMDALLKTATVMPMVNQIHLCPGDTPEDVISYCRSRNILLEGYSPLGHGDIFNVPELKEIAEKHGKSVAQVCLRWSLQMGFLPLPKSITPSRIKENAQVFDFALSQEDMDTIAKLDGCAGYGPDPDDRPF